MADNVPLLNQTNDENLVTSGSQSTQPGVDSDLHIDIQGHFSGQTNIKNHPEFELELPQSHFTKSELINADPLFLLLCQNKIDEFQSKFKSRESQMIIHDDKYSTYLEYACNHGLIEVVKTLLQAGVNPNECSPNNETTPMMITAEKGYYSILKLLLNHVEISFEPIAQKTVLHSLFEGMLAIKNGLLKKNPTSDHLKCLEYLLKCEYSSKLDINFPDKDGNTPLHYAIKLKNDDIIRSLLNAGTYLGCKNRLGKIPLKSIPACLLESCLDNCISTNGKDCDDDDYEITFDYSMITHPNPKEFASTKKDLIMNETETLLTINQTPELRKLLDHPVLLSFVKLKWNYISCCFYINLIFYFTFCLSLTTYIFFINSEDHIAISNQAPMILFSLPEKRNDLNVTQLLDNSYNTSANASTENHTRLQNGTSSGTSNVIESVKNTDYVLRYTTLVLCFLLILRELYQFYISSWQYFKSFENWLEITLIFKTLVLLLYTEMDLELQRQFSSVAIMLSCLELMLLIGRHPILSANVEMLKTVSHNFFKFFILYTIPILAFSFSFHILFRDNNIFFKHPILSIIKTITMLVSEFEAEKILRLPFKSEHIISYVIFLMFIFFVSIILFNLLTGLAVSDIHAIRADAELFGIVSTIKFISYVETAAIAFERFKCVHTIVRYCTSVSFRQAKRKRNQQQQIFHKDAKPFPYLYMDKKVRILPNKKNLKQQNVSPEFSKNAVIQRYFRRLDTRILSNSVEILERNIGPKSTEEKCIRQNF